MSYRVMVASTASRKALAIAYSLKRVLKAFVIGVSHRPRHPYIYSRFFDIHHTIICDRSSPKWPTALAKLAEELRVELIIPVDFIDVVSCSRHASFFERRGIMLAAPDYKKVVMVANKELLIKLVKNITETPKTVVFRELSDARLVEELKPPLVVKGLGDASVPDYFPSTKLAVMEAIKRAPCLVQEYVVGRGRGYFTVALNGETILEFTHERIVEYDPVGGASLAARGPILDPNLYALGRSIVKKFKWSGPIMIETKWQSETGKYYILEINPKFWGSLDLPVRLGFHFPAMLALAYLEGVGKAKELAHRLSTHYGEFYWVLDSMRYLAKLPSTWLFITRRACVKPQYSDLYPLDPARVLAQVAKAYTRLSREHVTWLNVVKKDLAKLKEWIRVFLSKAVLYSGAKLVMIFDLDGTIANLAVDWGAVKKELIRLGLARPWETVTHSLFRLWRENRKNYQEASKLIENYELAAKVRPVARNIRELRQLYRSAVLCLATRQSVRAAKRALEDLKLNKVFKYIIGRDSGVGPSKSRMYRECLHRSKCTNKDLVIAISDNLAEVIEAQRLGLLPLRVVSNHYELAKTLRLGIPALRHVELIPALSSFVSWLLGNR